jgi:hypothetical protein
MAYLVNITARAQRDLARLYRQIDADNSDLALKWYRVLERQIQVEVLHLRHGARRRFKESDVT